EHVVLAFYGIDLVDHQYRVAGLGQQGQQLRIARRPLARLDHMDHHVDIGQRLRDHAIHHAVHGTAVPRLESRRIDKNELFMLARQHAMYAVPRGLGLARHNGNLAAYQRIGQRGFAHIGAPDDGDKAATKGICHLFSWETATGRESCVDFRARPERAPLAGTSAPMAAMASSAADCSAARRLEPPAATLISSLGTWHSTSNI